MFTGGFFMLNAHEHNRDDHNNKYEQKRQQYYKLIHSIIRIKNNFYYINYNASNK